VAEFVLALLVGAEPLARIHRDRTPLDNVAVAVRSRLPARLVRKRGEERFFGLV
jgi:hypothetical protein